MVFPPAIAFHPKPKKKADDDKDDETKTVTFKVTIGRGEDATKAEKTEWSFRVFEDGGDAEEYVKWRIRFEELAEAMHLNTPDKKYHVLQQALRGEARARFNTAWHSVDIPSSLSTNKALELSEKRLNKGYNALAKQLFVPVDSAWRRQRSYLRYHVKFGNMTVAEFKRRLVEQNEFLKYFPTPAGKKSVSKLTEEELVEIIDRAKPVEYHCDVLANNYDPYQKTLQEYTEYLERLEVKHHIQKAMAKRDNQQVNTMMSPVDATKIERKSAKMAEKAMEMHPMAMAPMELVNSVEDLVTTRLIVGKMIEMQANVPQVTRPTKTSAIVKPTGTITSYLVSLRSR